MWLEDLFKIRLSALPCQSVYFCFADESRRSRQPEWALLLQLSHQPPPPGWGWAPTGTWTPSGSRRIVLAPWLTTVGGVLEVVGQIVDGGFGSRWSTEEDAGDYGWRLRIRKVNLQKHSTCKALWDEEGEFEIKYIYLLSQTVLANLKNPYILEPLIWFV